MKNNVADTIKIIAMLKKMDKKLDYILGTEKTECKADEDYQVFDTKIINGRSCHYINGVGWVDDETGMKL